MTALHCFVTFSLLSSCLAAKFVMFPLFSRSHYLVLAKLGEELSARGHEVQVFVGDMETYVHKIPTARTFKTSQGFKNGWQYVLKVIGKTRPDVVKEMSHLGRLSSIYCGDVLKSTEVMKAVANADLVVSDSFHICGSLIAAKFSLPFVTVFANSLSIPTAHAFGLPLTPSYVPQYKSALSDNMNFLGRIQNVYHWIVNYYLFYNAIAPHFQDLKDGYQIALNKSLYEVLKGVDLIIAQMGFFLDFPRPILPNTRVVGPLLPSPSKPLPGELEEFMQSSGDNGVILAAFGGTFTGDKTILSTMANAFAQLPQKVIWKLSEAEASSIEVSGNIKTASWLPQNDILGHPKTRLWVGHAGLNGIFESIYHGVPVVCSPLFADHFDNARAAKLAGFAEILDIKEATTEQLVSVIHTVLTNPSYRKSAERISKSIKQLPRTPVQEAADWVEYTQAQGGLQYLRPRGLDLPFYQLYLLDILLLAVVILIIVFVLVKFLFEFIKSSSMFKKKEKAP